MREIPKNAVPWACAHGHVLGFVVRVKVGNARVKRLLKLRFAVLGAQDAIPELIDCAIEGTVYNISCSVCDSERTWVVER
jgi:hypothetical protein